MKKIVCVLIALVGLSAMVFAQDGGNSWLKNVRIEADVSVGILSNGIELRSAYRDNITENPRWDAGIDIGFTRPSLLGVIASATMSGAGNSSTSLSGSTNINVFGSFWFYAFYVQYGLGVGFTDAGVAFNPYDVRIGFQPGINEENRHWNFKMELGVFSWLYTIQHSSGEKVKVTNGDALLTLGCTYKF